MAVETEEGSPSPLNLATERRAVAPGRWLTVLWPLAILFHLAGNGGYLLALQHSVSAVGLVQLAVVGAAVWMLVAPRPLAAGALAATFVLVLWLKLPAVGNHEIILGLFSLAVIPALLAAGSQWPRRIAPAGRSILLISYGFIAFSKLNTGFLDTVESCAVLFADEFGGIVGIRPSGSTALSAVIIAATVVIELCVPVLLLSRFRRLGVAVALSFHFILALDPASHVWDFSATLLPLFLLFAAPQVRAVLDARLGALDRRPVTERLLIVLLVLAVQAVVMGGVLPVPTWAVAFPLWLVVSGAVTIGYWMWFAQQREDAEPVPTRPMLFTSGPAWLTGAMLLIAGVAILNGIAPYIELRNAGAFNMYSNLRVVDGESNHLIVGGIRSGDEASYVSVVEVDEGSTLGFYVERELMVPNENLDSFLAEHRDEDPLIAGPLGAVRARSLGFGATDPDVGWFDRMQSSISRKLGARRAVHQSGGTGATDGLNSGAAQRCLRAWGPIG